MVKKVYGVVRSGNGETVICYVKEVMTGGASQTSPAPVSKKKAQKFAVNMTAIFGADGNTYTVFKMKFKETI
jgi:hypothetical protein